MLSHTRPLSEHIDELSLETWNDTFHFLLITHTRTQMPKRVTWASAEEAVRDAVELEKELNVKLHNIHKNAERICADPHVS